MEQKFPHVFHPGMINPSEPVEKYEKAIQQMREWLSKIYLSSKIDRALKTEKILRQEDETEVYLDLTAKIWTFNNTYRIIAHIYLDNDHTYLGCTASCRKSRTGETWTRGNDLPDGEFNQETWDKIMVGIVRYETEEVKSDKWKKGSNIF